MAESESGSMPINATRETPGNQPPAPRNRVWLARVLHDQPALILTVGYLILTLLGIGYQYTFFLQFRVNILDYAEISDFLLAALRDPAVILLGFVPLFLLWSLQVGGDWLRTKDARYAALSRKTDTPASRAVIYPVFIAVYFFLFALLYAKRIAEPIKAGEGKRVLVELASNPTSGAPAATEALLLGKTSAFIFLYYPAERRTHIVPIENIARIVVLRLVRVEADSGTG